MTTPVVSDERFIEACAVRDAAECILSADQVADCYGRMADRITQSVAGHNPVILCVMLGGLVPTARIIQHLDFGFELDYLQATRYGHDTRGSQLVWKASPQLDLVDRDVVVIDDILDEGHTLAAIIDALQHQGLRSLQTAVLLDKQHGRRVPDLAADIVGALIPDRYVFGAGMDYRGYFRQLPGIWAVAADERS